MSAINNSQSSSSNSKSAKTAGKSAKSIAILGVALIAFGAIAVIQGATSVKLGLDLRGGTSVTLTPRATEDSKITPEAISQAVEIIRQRVNSLGVAESEVAAQGSGTNRQIVISVPGETGEKIVELVGQTAELRFRQVLVEAAPNALSVSGDTQTATLPNGVTPELSARFAALDCTNRANLQGGSTESPDVAVVSCDRGGTAKYILAPAQVLGNMVSKATAAIDQQGAAGWYVSLDFNGEGASKFGALTSSVTGLAAPQNQVAIVLDGLVVSAPRINEAINGGSAQITGSFSQEEAVAITTIVPMINGMAQIEIFKMFREIEADRYDKDTIVREAYKILRILKSINAVTSISYPAIACQTQNLITDVKVIIGLTTIQDEKEQKMVIHDRRICSAEQEVFNSGASISRMYITDEEEYEEEAIRAIKAAKAADPEQPHQEAYEEFNDALPSIIATAPPPMIHTSPDDYVDTPFNASGGGGGAYYYHRHGSEVRALCVRIAVARNKKEDTTAEELYQQMQTHRFNGMYDPEEYIPVGDRDDTFSSTPMDDYTQRRIGIMRQVSSS